MVAVVDATVLKSEISIVAHADDSSARICAATLLAKETGANHKSQVLASLLTHIQTIDLAGAPWSCAMFEQRSFDSSAKNSYAL